MIIDLHFHTELYSPCSRMSLEDGLCRAKEIGLDGVCITEHDVFHQNPNLNQLSLSYGVAIFVGTEINSIEGDILCFGLDLLPDKHISAGDLVFRVEELQGATIAAHPFRDNNRGIGDLISSLPGLTAVEAFNGNTALDQNLAALKTAGQRGLPVTGSSDAHSAERVGFYATEFPGRIDSADDLVLALRRGDCTPVRYDGSPGRFQRLL